MVIRKLGVLGVVLAASGCIDALGFGPDIFLTGVDTVIVVEPFDASAAGSRPEELPAPPVVAGPLLLQAHVTSTDTSSASPPMSLWFNVTATNPGDTSVVLGVDGCTVWPDVYGSSARLGEPLWTPQGQCAQAAYTRLIAPKGVTTFEFLAHDAMLGHALPDGRYYVSLKFRKTGQHMTLNAGHADVRLREPGLSFRIRVNAEGDGARVEIVAGNLNSAPLHIEFGACALRMALYRDQALTDLATPWHTPFACPDYLAATVISPGGSAAPDEFSGDFDPSWLSDVGYGAYYLAAQLTVNWHTYVLPAGSVVLH